MRLEAEANVHYIRSLVESVRAGHNGDAGTLRIMLAKVAGTLNLPGLLRMGDAMLLLAIDEAKCLTGQRTILRTAGVAEKSNQPQAPQPEQFS